MAEEAHLFLGRDQAGQLDGQGSGGVGLAEPVGQGRTPHRISNNFKLGPEGGASESLSEGLAGLELDEGSFKSAIKVECLARTECGREARYQGLQVR